LPTVWWEYNGDADWLNYPMLSGQHLVTVPEKCSGGNSIIVMELTLSQGCAREMPGKNAIKEKCLLPTSCLWLQQLRVI